MDEMAAIEIAVTYGSYGLAALIGLIGFGIFHAAKRAQPKTNPECQRRTMQVTGLGCMLSSVLVAVTTFLGMSV